MTVHIFMVAVLISLTSSVGGLKSLVAVEQDHSSLKYVYAFFRHRIRTPIFEPYPNDPNKSNYNESFPGPRGQLSKIGKQMMYKVGEQLKIKYRKFLGDFADEKVHISSTESSRTLMTAQTVMAGLFPPSKPILDNLQWQPVPVWQDSRDFDKVYFYSDANFPERAMKECPKYGAFIKKGCDKIKRPDKSKGRYKLYDLLEKYTGLTVVNSVNTLIPIWDTLQFESLNGLPLPSWCSELQPDYKDKPLYPNLMQPVVMEWFRDIEYLNDSKEMLQFYSGPLLNIVHEKMNKKIKELNNSEIMRYHFTHDTTLIVLLWAFGLKKPALIGPGDGIIFELHNVNGTSVIKVLYYDTNHGHQIRELMLPECPSPCVYHQFVNNYPGISPEQWQKNCID